MSKLRQRPLVDPRGRVGAAVTTLIYDYPPNYVVPEHVHDEDQLVYASEGVMTVQTAEAFWTVPPQRAVWVPAREPHSIRMSGRVAMRTLYLRAGLAKRLPREVRVLNVSSLLRELTVHICGIGALDRRKPQQRRLLDVLLDLVASSGAISLELPQPRDSRARRVASVLLEDPGNDHPLDVICAQAGGSRRTIERAFEAETRMTLGAWRQRASCIHAIRLLAGGANVTRVALESGYGSASAFISMFRRVLGVTPGRYFAAQSTSPVNE